MLSQDLVSSTTADYLYYIPKPHIASKNPLAAVLYATHLPLGKLVGAIAIAFSPQFVAPVQFPSADRLVPHYGCQNRYHPDFC
jgi:hypothetical protein